MGGEPGELDPDGPTFVAQRSSRKRQHDAVKLVEAAFSDAGRTIPMARLVAIDETQEKAREVAKRAAQWTVGSYVGRKHPNVRQERRTFGGKDPIDFYLADAISYGTADSVAEPILAFGAEIGMDYLMAAPLSGRSFRLLPATVLSRIVG